MDGHRFTIPGCNGSRCARGHSNRNDACMPVIRDHKKQHLLSHNCKTMRGGTPTIGAPEYKLHVTNP